MQTLSMRKLLIIRNAKNARMVKNALVGDAVVTPILGL
jgi:hypothetical protein